MNFTVEYCLDGNTERIEVVLSEGIIEQAQSVGYDLASVKTMAMALLDQFFFRVTGTTNLARLNTRKPELE